MTTDDPGRWLPQGSQDAQRTELLDALAGGLAALQRDKIVPSDFSAAHVTWATPLDDLGLDSVARVALMTLLEERLELVLEQGRFEAAETVGDIIEGILDARTVS